MYQKIISSIILAIIGSTCSACSNSFIPDHHYAGIAKKMGKGADKSFRWLVLQPDFLNVSYPGIVFGIEKASRETVGEPEFGNCDGKPYCLENRTGYFGLPSNSEIAGELEGMVKTLNSKIVFPSHIVVFDNGNASTTGRKLFRSCFLHNIYRTKAQNCPDSYFRTQYGVETNADEQKKNYFQQAWDSMPDAKKVLKKLIIDTNATHLIFISMGWNTPQMESLANFETIIANIARAAGRGKKRFSPVFIGITWPSQWDNFIGDVGLDLINKARDADEVGILWGSRILRDMVLPMKTDPDINEHRGLKEKLKVVVIGHSFGSRLTTRAVHSMPLFGEVMQKVDYLIGLQGAFTANRFVELSVSKAPYKDYKKFAKHLFFTTSVNDEAVDSMATFARVPYIGSDNARQLLKEGDSAEEYREVFEILPVDKEGVFTGQLLVPACESGKVKLINADMLIHENHPGTGGGAHSDIYSEEVGTMIWQVMNTCLP